MIKKAQLVVLLILFVLAAGLFGDKPKERLANEKGVEGENFFEAGQFAECAVAMEEAIQLFNEAVAEDGIPTDEEKIGTWLSIAFSAYYKANDIENALKIQNERIKFAPDDIALYNNKALVLKKIKRFDEALEVYMYMNSMKPDYKVCKSIAKIYKGKEDWDNALLWYNNSYNLKQDSKTINNIAVINLQLGRNEAAIQAYKDFLSTKPSSAAMIRTYKNLGKLYEDLGDETNSIMYYKLSLELKYDPLVAMHVIDKFFEMKDYDKCLQDIAAYLEVKPGNAEVVYYRAQILYDRGDKIGARADFEAIKGDPKYKATAIGFIESIDSE